MDQPSHNKSDRSGWQASLRSLGCLSIGILVVIVLAYFTSGKVGVEKTATRLVLPVGALWLGLSWLAIDALLRGRRLSFWCLLAVWLLYTLIGTGPLPDQLIAQLESKYPPFQPGLEQDLDVLVVLGGGTNQGPQRAQAGLAGDRVLLAAQLYLSGHVRQLVTTGDSIAGVGGKLTGPKEQTLEIWLALGIPEDDILQINGVNTYAEMQNLKKIAEGFEGKRVGLLTSANHLPRAMRLAEKAGISDLIAVPADFQSRADRYAVYDLIPGAGAIEKFSRWQHEVMGRLLGR